MKRHNYIIILFLVLTLFSCDGNREQRGIVTEYVGKQINIPEGLTYQIIEGQFEYDFNDADYKIITYVDSTGCTSCKMKLSLWNDVLDELKTIDDVDVNFLMVVNSTDKNEVSYLLKSAVFKHPVAIDTKGAFSKENDIPDAVNYRTFLLDSNNKIVAIGNPAVNPKIKELYEKIISGEPGGVKNKESVLVEHPIMNVGLVSRGDTIKVSFMIENKDTIPYHIEGVVPSCECMRVECGVDVLLQSEKGMISVELYDTTKQNLNKYIDIYYKERKNPERIFIHGTIKS